MAEVRKALDPFANMPNTPPPPAGNAPLTWGQALSPPFPKDPNAGGGSWGPYPVMTGGMTYREVGASGLRAFSGWVREEFLPALQGRQAAQKFREMIDNSPVVGAIKTAVEATMRKVEWRVVPANDSPEAQEKAEFVEGLMDDMTDTWEDTVVEDLSAMWYGFAPKEIVYKKRLGPTPGPDPTRPGHSLPTSDYDDGLIGWRRLPLRGQDTVIKWFFDENGAIKGMTQQPWTGFLIDLPIEKMLLFRPSQHKNNPEGRALDPETPIPTPDGWRKLDDLAEGDKVFDERGMIRYVVARADWKNRPCFRVTFGDGSEMIADANHLWKTRTLIERSKGIEAKVRTTADLAASVKTGIGSSNHSIAWAEPLDYPEQSLPLAPYFLGQWLGDGTSLASHISCHVQDAEETVELINACGYDAQLVVNGKLDGNGRLIKVFSKDGRWDSQGPQALLRALGLRGNKHIPTTYLRGSVEQRRALLAGLMDSDGTVDVYGRCEFNNCNLNLIYGVAELVRSLGCSAFVSLRGHAGVGNRKQDSWAVKFRPEWSPFRLSRKAARVRGHRARDQHYIKAVEPIESRRTVCIEVDSPSHLFLAGEAMIPTHNSCLRSAYVPYYFIKRMQEQEAILGERLGGLPMVKVPQTLIEAASSGDANALAAMAAYKKMATNVRIDEQMGIVLPSDTYPGPNGPSNVPLYSFELVTPQGGRGTALNFDVTITRYNTAIFTSVMADFMVMGHNTRGAQNLGETKVDMFFQAIEGYLNSNAAIYNRHGLTRLWDLNGFDRDLLPSLEPDLAQRIDLDALSNFVLRLSQAGMPMFPNEDLQSFLLDAGGLPDLVDERAMQAAGVSDAQLEMDLEREQEQLDQLKNPPEPTMPPKGTTPLQKMILASIARRMINMQGPRFGITTYTTKRSRSRHRH